MFCGCTICGGLYVPNTLIIEKIAKEKNNTFAENIYAMILFFHIFELPHPTDVGWGFLLYLG